MITAASHAIKLSYSDVGRDGNAFLTCTQCTLEVLNLTCTCIEDKGPASKSQETRISLGERYESADSLVC